MVAGRLYTMDRVVNVLPASVEKFTLKQLMEDEDMRNLFEHLAELKAEKLPALKTITYESGRLKEIMVDTYESPWHFDI